MDFYASCQFNPTPEDKRKHKNITKYTFIPPHRDENLIHATRAQCGAYEVSHSDGPDEGGESSCLRPLLLRLCLHNLDRVECHRLYAKTKEK